MRNGEQVERSEVEAVASLVALRRRFLVDMAWPALSAALCDMFGLPRASDEVAEQEALESNARMNRMADERLGAVYAAALDMVALLDEFEDPEERAVWLTTYALAMVNMLEDLGVVTVEA